MCVGSFESQNSNRDKTVRRYTKNTLTRSDSGRTASIIRFPAISCAPGDISRIADGLDRFCVFADRTQTPDRLLLQRVVIPVQAVRPVMRTQVMPQVLHRIELRRVRRQLDQAHIAGHHHILTGVEARPVPDQHRMHPGGQLARELLQEQVDDLGVQRGHDHRRHRPRGGGRRPPARRAS